MSAITEGGKWTCPACHVTVTVYAPAPDTDYCLRVLQQRHGRAHRVAAQMLDHRRKSA